MAEEKTGLKEKIGLFIDKKLTFGGGLSISQKIIDAGEKGKEVIEIKEDSNGIKSAVPRDEFVI